jgi:hypothetical protein
VRGADPAELTLSGGYRGFEWKPDPSFDFHAGQMQVTALVRMTAGADRRHEIDFSTGYILERRFYRGFAEVNKCAPGAPIVDGCLAFTDVGRSDWFQQAAVELTYIGPVLVGLGYALQLTRRVARAARGRSQVRGRRTASASRCCATSSP